jgi:Tol biopolymer transport system component
MRRYARELTFGLIAIVLVVGYGVLGSRAAPLVLPAGAPTPTPTKPVSAVTAPQTSGTIAFALRGDVYVLREGKYVSVTSDARSIEPNLSDDGRTLLFARAEAINGKRTVDGQVTPAILRYTDIVKKDPSGGAESIVLSGLLITSPGGFHTVAWYTGPALSPDAKRFAVTTDAASSGASDLEIFDLLTGKRALLLSEGSNLADPSWSPDGRTIAVTSYTSGEPHILLVPSDGRAAAPLAIKGATGESYRPSYSPDGAWITYTLRHDGRNDVHAVDVKTGQDVALTSDGKSWNGVFSPDGRQIAFVRESGGLIDLYFMDVAEALTGGPVRAAVKLTRGEGIDGDSRPAWGR